MEKTVTVKTPVAGFNGKIGNDVFIDGVCQVPESALDYYLRHGYIIDQHAASRRKKQE